MSDESRKARPSDARFCIQAAEKEALLVRQEEERAEQRRKAKAEKKAQKKSQKTNRTGDKRKAEDVGEDEWGDESGKGGRRMPFTIKQPFLFEFVNSDTRTRSSRSQETQR